MAQFVLEPREQRRPLELAPLGITVTMIEPGPFRTDFAGRSAAHGECIPDYAPILEPSRERFAALDGNQSGDPARAAQAVVAVVGLDQPPLRLPLGGAAFDRIREQLAGRLAELDAVEGLGRDTDFVVPHSD